ncbi:MAG: O-antigen ligase family protein [Pseudomonadota bacterium]
MDTVYQALWTALPFAVVLGLALVSVAGVGVGLVSPRWLVYPYLAIFFLFNSAHYGNLQLASGPGVYSRGSGMLYFALVSWAMLGAWCCARAQAGFARLPTPECNLRPWFWGWLLLLALHAGVALALGRTLSEALAPTGFSNIVWMAPLVSLMLMAFRSRAAATGLARFIVCMGLARALYGLVRWAAFGGDPNNVYANMNAIQIKLTFFDINDSLLCCIAFAIAAVQLFQAGGAARSRFWVALDWAALGATGLCIVLSYRRSAWIGLLLAMLVLMPRFAVRRRVALLLVGLPAVLAGFGYVALKRFAQGREAGLENVFYDMQSRRFGNESERVLELKLALADFLSNPLTGIGSWGRYAGYQRISWQANPDGGQFLHSGVLHIALKSGVPGLLLLGGLAWAFIAFTRRALRCLPPELAGLGAAGAAGLAFMLPDILIGTPIPQVRTTQMMALCLALPYVALAASRAPTPS